jgi:hypothetical protein
VRSTNPGHGACHGSERCGGSEPPERRWPFSLFFSFLCTERLAPMPGPNLSRLEGTLSRLIRASRAEVGIALIHLESDAHVGERVERPAKKRLKAPPRKRQRPR